jgi:hypothetical protein
MKRFWAALAIVPCVVLYVLSFFLPAFVINAERTGWEAFWVPFEGMDALLTI